MLTDPLLLTGPLLKLPAQYLALREAVSFDTQTSQCQICNWQTPRRPEKERERSDRTQSNSLEKRPSESLEATNRPVEDRGSPKQWAPTGKLEMFLQGPTETDNADTQ